MASKKLIALSMLCYLLDGSSTVELIDNQEPSLGFKEPGLYPFQFDDVDAVNRVPLPNTPHIHWVRQPKEAGDSLKITFAKDTQFRTWVDGLTASPEFIEAMALKRYSHYLKIRLGGELRGHIQAIYRVLFNALPRKHGIQVSDCKVDLTRYLLTWQLGDWSVEADLNVIVGATVESVEYDYLPAQHLVVVHEHYGAFTTTHYIDLLLHSTPMRELRKRATTEKLHLDKDTFLNNITMLPISVKPLDGGRILSLKII